VRDAAVPGLRRFADVHCVLFGPEELNA